MNTAGIAPFEILVLAVGMLLAAVFASAETSLAAMSEARAKQLVEKGGRRARVLAFWLDKPHQTLTAILIGNLASNATVAVVATLVADRVFDNFIASAVVAALVITLLAVCEIIPRSFAKHHAAVVAPTVMPVVLVTYYLTLPLVEVFTRFSHLIVKVTGGTLTRSGPFVTEDDIMQMITLGNKEGVLDKAEGRMLASIFELGDTLVKEVMTPRTEISSLPVNASFEDVMREVREQGHSRMPVFDETLDEVKGFFHAKDLFALVGEGGSAPATFKLREHLRPVIYVPELMKTSDLLKRFQREKVHLAVVVDEYGGTAGIVALEDVLEEIVGPIHDEHDDEEATLKKIDDNRYTAEGRAVLYELSEALGVTFPEDGVVETLGGFLVARSGRMLRKGDRLSYGGWVFHVLDADEKRVARVAIERGRARTATQRLDDNAGMNLTTSGESQPPRDVVTDLAREAASVPVGEPVTDDSLAGVDVASPAPRERSLAPSSVRAAMEETSSSAPEVSGRMAAASARSGEGAAASPVDTSASGEGASEPSPSKRPRLVKVK